LIEKAGKPKSPMTKKREKQRLPKTRKGGKGSPRVKAFSQDEKNLFTACSRKSTTSQMITSGVTLTKSACLHGRIILQSIHFRNHNFADSRGP